MKFDPSAFPTKTGVYLMKDGQKRILYIGKARSIAVRLKQYFSLHDERAMVPMLIEQVETIDTILTRNEKEALLLENTLIKQHQPKYNVCLKDDKTFLAIRLSTKREWPMLDLVRMKELSYDQGEIFGPYTSAFSARKTFELLKKLFPLRKCTDKELYRRKRPCILHGMKRCLAPCVGLCTADEYQSTVRDAIHFMHGNTKEVLSDLKRKRDAAAEEKQFEKAQIYHEHVLEIEDLVTSKTAVYPLLQGAIDVIGFSRSAGYIFIVILFFRDGKLTSLEHHDFANVVSDDAGALTSFLMQHYQEAAARPDHLFLPFEIEQQSVVSSHLGLKITIPKAGKKRQLVELARINANEFYEQEKNAIVQNEDLLARMQETLMLKNFPSRIECFDTSNLSGKDAVAAMVVAIDGKIEKKESRLYKIKNSEGDDYNAMKEVLERRYKKTEKGNLPDMIVLDGGKGQLAILEKLLERHDIVTIDTLALAKEEGRHDKGITREKIYRGHGAAAVELDRFSPLLFFLQTLRDEAHRRAIGYHKKRRAKTLFRSLIDNIEGIGPRKKEKLIKAFGSPKAALLAPEELLKETGFLTEANIKALKQRAYSSIFSSGETESSS
ncbi:MAG: excinuclease ABC subunit C [Chlamydiae bacterium RIFCSPHIGHO2_12_FULL_49_11]|nr:MAG: excinuclease ABC subunit C [Chlamydiae bacterium RIFCSPHIGHO2_12_FULL_49_11]